MTKAQSWLLTALGSAALVAGVLLASGAFGSAQSPTPAPAGVSSTNPATAANSTATPAPGGFRDNEGPGERQGRRLSVLGEAASVLGVNQSDLESALASGQTLAQIAQEQGMNATSFQSALKDRVTSDLQAAANAGDISQQQFDAITSELDGFLSNLLNQASGEGGERGEGGEFRGQPGVPAPGSGTQPTPGAGSAPLPSSGI